MVHRGNTREPKFLHARSSSNSLAKWRRHRNKERIWRRAVKRLARALQYENAASLEAAFVE